MRTAKTISKKMEHLVSGKYARYSIEAIGVLAWVLGLADSIPKGEQLALEAVKSKESRG